jgi:hypothetical protein
VIKALDDEKSCAAFDYRSCLINLFFDVFFISHIVFVVASLRHYIREGATEGKIY